MRLMNDGVSRNRVVASEVWQELVVAVLRETPEASTH